MKTANTAPVIDAPQLVADDFLHQIFGYPCYRVAKNWTAPALQNDMQALGAPAFVCAQAAPSESDALRHIGFVDTVGGITYDRAPAPLPAQCDDVEILVIAASDAAQHRDLADAVGDLAARALTTSRFHQDRQIPATIAAEIKRRWARNFFNGTRGDKMIVARAKNGDIVGFNQVLNAARHHVIDLICVDAGHRRSGIARALIAAMDVANVPVRVGSQIGNVSADRFYKNLGFIPTQTSAYMHWHADIGQDENT